MDLNFELISLLIVASVCAGLLAGILGIGGGLIIVPMLNFVFGRLDMDIDMIVRMSVATSLFIIIFTSITNVVSHYKSGNIDTGVIKTVGPFIAIGTIIGVSTATYLKGAILHTFFSVSLFFVAFNMLFGRKTALIENGPSKPQIRTAGIFIGTFSSILGIGAASIGVPTFTLLNFPIRKAIGNITAMSLIIALPSSFMFFIEGLRDNVEIPYSLGYINLLVAVIMIPITTLFVPQGVKIGKKLNQALLKKIFALFILFVSIRPLITYFIEHILHMTIL